MKNYAYGTKEILKSHLKLIVPEEAFGESNNPKQRKMMKIL